MEQTRNSLLPIPRFSWPISGDRVGVIASVLCAIHCAATPVLLLVLPVFGKVWSHPASHWLMALLVVPLAGVTVATGFKRHRRKWIIASGVLGIVFVLVGAAAPGFEANPLKSAGDLAAVSPAESSPDNGTGECMASAGFSESDQGPAEELMECSASVSGEGAPDSSTGECVDACCPSIQATAGGGWKLHIPLASILTTIGGLFLIATHVGNLCRCAHCHTEKAVA